MMKKVLLYALFIASLVLWPATAWQADVCVDPGGGYDYTDFQSALTAGETNGEAYTIKVVQGTYYGSFTYQSDEGYNISIKGGYTTGCAGQVINPSNTILDASGESKRVLFLYNSNGGDILVEGFTIKNGDDISTGGGGVYIESYSSFSTAGNVTITKSAIENNTTNSNGGGVIVRSRSGSGAAGSVSFTHNSVTGNYSNGFYGGGVKAYSHSTSGTAGIILIDQNYISGNTVYSAGGGGGIHAYSYAESNTSDTVILTNNTIKNNTAVNGSGGGAVAISSGSTGSNTVTLNANTITGNNSSNRGGAYIYTQSDSGTAGDILLTNNAIADNTAFASSAGGVEAQSFSSSGTSGSITLTNNTITENSSNSNGGGVYLWLNGNTINICNSIIWENTASSGDDIFFNGTGTAYGYNNIYSDMSGSWASESGNTDFNPTFVGGGDYHLSASSPCINAGFNNAPEIPEHDFEGDPRINSRTVDIGADEFIKSIVSQFLLLLLN